MDLKLAFNGIKKRKEYNEKNDKDRMSRFSF
jgi:hypothetical protein